MSLLANNKDVLFAKPSFSENWFEDDSTIATCNFGFQQLYSLKLAKNAVKWEIEIRSAPRPELCKLPFLKLMIDHDYPRIHLDRLNRLI